MTKTINKTKIPWPTHAWPVYVGCKRGCTVETCGYNCYAKRDFWRYQRLYPEMKGKFENVSFIQRNFDKTFPKKPAKIFINPSSDPEYWDRVGMFRILEKIRGNLQHIFMMLTKSISEYSPSAFDWGVIPNNLWLGITANDTTAFIEAQKSLLQIKNNTKFLSLEPIREEIPVELFDPEAIDWLIIGGQSGPGKKFYPSIAWVAKLVLFCERNEIPLFFKDNLLIDASGVIQKPTKRYQWPQVKK